MDTQLCSYFSRYQGGRMKLTTKESTQPVSRALRRYRKYNPQEDAWNRRRCRLQNQFYSKEWPYIISLTVPGNIGVLKLMKTCREFFRKWETTGIEFFFVAQTRESAPIKSSECGGWHLHGVIKCSQISTLFELIRDWCATTGACCEAQEIKKMMHTKEKNPDAWFNYIIRILEEDTKLLKRESINMHLTCTNCDAQSKCKHEFEYGIATEEEIAISTHFKGRTFTEDELDEFLRNRKAEQQNTLCDNCIPSATTSRFIQRENSTCLSPTPPVTQSEPIYDSECDNSLEDEVAIATPSEEPFTREKSTDSLCLMNQNQPSVSSVNCVAFVTKCHILKSIPTPYRPMSRLEQIRWVNPLIQPPTVWKSIRYSFKSRPKRFISTLVRCPQYSRIRACIRHFILLGRKLCGYLSPQGRSPPGIFP